MSKPFKSFEAPGPEPDSRVFPWAVSIVLHVIVIVFGIVAVFLAGRWHFVTSRLIVPPSSFRNPVYSEHAGGAAKVRVEEDVDPFRAPDANKRNTRTPTPTPSLSQLSLPKLPEQTPAANAATPTPLLRPSRQMSSADQTPATPAAPTSAGDAKFGSASQGGSAGGGSAAGGSGAPKLTFLGAGGNARRIVYILDRSASLVDHFEFLKHEVTNSINHLIPLQSFNVVLVSDHAVPIEGRELVRATGAEKKHFADLLQPYVAEGANDGTLTPFQQGFEQAFAMRPELIFFLTDGEFDPALIDVVKRMNARAAASGYKIVVSTIAYTTHAEKMVDQLKTLANQNGGVYKFISGDPGENR